MFSPNMPDEIHDLFVNIRKISQTLFDEHRRALTPITVYVDSMTPIQKRMADILPQRAVCDQLLDTYLTYSETIYRIVHIPVFTSQYNQFWQGTAQHDSFLPQLLSILAIGSRFMGRQRGLTADRAEGIHIATAVALVRSWVDSLRGSKRIEFPTVQVEVLLCMAQRMITPRNEDSWTQLGLVVRMAMTMGLHRDPSEFGGGMSPFWAELRRRLWHTVLELDVHMSMQCNFPCGIKEGDYTCKPPRNINDDDLFPEMMELPDPLPFEQYSDMQMQVYSASTLHLRFRAVGLLNRIDTLRDYQPVIELATELERVFEDLRYLLPRSATADNGASRRPWVTRTVLDLHCRRFMLALYRPFALSAPDAPQAISTGYLRSAMVALSYLDDVDPNGPNYWDFWHMYHLILKPEILQSAFSLCFYVKNIANKIGSPGGPSWRTSSNGQLMAAACSNASESSILLSPPRLLSTVELVFENLVSRAKEPGTDMKDLSSLATVLATLQGGPREQKIERMKANLRAILDAGMLAIHATPETLASLPVCCYLAA